MEKCYKNLVKNTILIFWIATLFFSCLNKKSSPISTNNLKIIKNKYSSQVINYFYETAFHQEDKIEKENNIVKWIVNPKIVILGSPSINEKLFVKNAILTLNKLNIPIKYSLDTALKNGDINIYFGSSKYLKSVINTDKSKENIFNSSQSFGICQIESNNGIIEKIKIGILSSALQNGIDNQEKIILEEIIQSIGIIGDSYTYPRSLFFQNFNTEKYLTQIDREVLSLLYDPIIPVNYSRIDFENDFADIIFSINANEKIRKFIISNHIAKGVLDGIELCFIKGVFYKRPKENYVYLNGDYSVKDSIQVQNTITSLNNISKNINMSLKSFPLSKPDVGIFLTFKKVDSQDNSISITDNMHRGFATMFPKRVVNDITISFMEKKANQAKKEKSIVDVLYGCLGPVPKANGFSDLYNQKGNQIQLNKPYIDILKTIYSDEFIDGYTIEEFEKLRKSFK